MRTLIINLTRFGDLLQTQPVISSFKKQGDEVALLCLDNFASAAGLLRDVDRVIPLRGARLLALLDDDWRMAVARLHELVREASEDFGAEHCVNLTPSLPGRLLARRVGGEAFHGFGIDAFGFNADESPWAAFLQLAAGERGSSPFNVCDLFRRTAGLTGPGVDLSLAKPQPEAMQEAKALLHREVSASVQGFEGDAPAGFAGIQLGASEDRRRWPVRHFQETARLLWQERRLVPVLLGTKSEAPLGVRFRQGADFPVVDLMGRTGLGVLAAVLSQLKVLLTNDTGTMHLATGLGIPVCAVFLATAQPWDTGPYRSGALCLEPDMPCHPCTFGADCPHDNACRGVVTPQVAARCARMLLDEGGRKDTVCGAGARVWQTCWDGDGLMTLRSLSGHEGEDRSAWIMVQREVYRRFLDAEDDLLVEARPMNPAMRDDLKEKLSAASDMLHLLASQATLLAREPLPPVKRKFLANVQRLQSHLESSPRLKVLGSLWYFQSQQYGRDLSSLAMLINRYHQLTLALVRSIS